MQLHLGLIEWVRLKSVSLFDYQIPDRLEKTFKGWYIITMIVKRK